MNELYELLDDATWVNKLLYCILLLSILTAHKFPRDKRAYQRVHITKMVVFSLRSARARRNRHLLLNKHGDLSIFFSFSESSKCLLSIR